jgi:hypothetical protein
MHLRTSQALPDAPTAPPDSGISAAKPGVAPTDPPEVIDEAWVREHLHLLDWEGGRMVLRLPGR